MNTITLPDLQDFLGYSDLRAIRNWCHKNNVLVIKQGKNEFVFETDFKEKFERPFINKLKKEFGDDWESVYRLYSEGNIPALNMLHSVPDVLTKGFKQQKNSYDLLFENYGNNKAA